MTRSSASLLIVIALAAPATAPQAQPWAAPATASPPLGAPRPAPVYRPIAWGSLVPPGWSAMQGFAGIRLDQLDDADPKAAALLKRMREVWDKAPVNMALVGQPVTLAGYVVPLEQGSKGLTEFLLVPYHGACIHTPPPPANQVVHVVASSPLSGVKTMDAVSISGVLRFARHVSDLAVSSWRVHAVAVAPYDPGPGAAR